MDYSEILRLLAQKKLEKEQMIADNTAAEQQRREDRQPSSIEPALPISGKDTQMIQDLNMLDKIKMKGQGLDPWNPDDVKKYRNSEGS